MPAAPLSAYALRRICRGYHRPWPQEWRSLCALGLSTTYGLLLLFASLCVATGVLHPAAPHDAHQHHAHPGAHHRTGAAAPPHSLPDAPHTSTWPDLCDLVRQVSTSTILWVVPQPSPGLLQGQALVSPVRSRVDPTCPLPISIRAPPVVIA